MLFKAIVLYFLKAIEVTFCRFFIFQKSTYLQCQKLFNTKTISYQLKLASVFIFHTFIINNAFNV